MIGVLPYLPNDALHLLPRDVQRFEPRAHQDRRMAPAVHCRQTRRIGAAEIGSRVTVPAAAPAQAVRRPERQVRLARLMRQPTTDVVSLDGVDATSVGRLLAASGTSDVIDAHVVGRASSGRAAKAIVCDDALAWSRASLPKSPFSTRLNGGARLSAIGPYLRPSSTTPQSRRGRSSPRCSGGAPKRMSSNHCGPHADAPSKHFPSEGRSSTWAWAAAPPAWDSHQGQR